MRAGITRFAVVAGAAVLMAGAVQAQPFLLRDNFDSGAATQTDQNNVNFNLAGRQTGARAPVTYRELAGSAVSSNSPNTTLSSTTNGGQRSQVNDALAPGALLFSTHGGSNYTLATDANGNPGGGNPSFTWVSPDLNTAAIAIANGYSPNYFDITFDINPGLGNTINTTGPETIDWGMIRFGDNTAGRFVNGGNGGYGVLFRQNGGYQLFDAPVGFTNTNTGTGAVTGTPLPGGFFGVSIRSRPVGADALVTITLDTADVDGNSLMPAVSFTKVGGFTNNIITLGASGTPTGSMNRVAFDNLQVVPEPATMAACLMGLAGIALRRRRK